jgi:hypothetical protein
VRTTPIRTVCWKPTWNQERSGIGLEHLVLSDCEADSVVLAFNDDGEPFRLTYRLAWDHLWRLRGADLIVLSGRTTRSLNLRADGEGHWSHVEGTSIPELEGCIDIDIWPTPFTNSFPIRRSPLTVGQRQEFRMAWICAPELSFKAQPQAYSRLEERLYLFENLDGTGFEAKLPVDEDFLVLDYPELFERVDGRSRTPR